MIILSKRLFTKNIPSKLVLPVFIYSKPWPKSIIQEDNPPNKKYVNPAFVDNSEFL